MQCPACNYEPTMREHTDSPDQCPSCRKFYAKIMAGQQRGAQQLQAVERVRDEKVFKSSVPAYIRESLSRGESVEAVFSLHWFAWVPVWLWAFGAVLTFGLLAPVAIYVWLSLRAIEQGVTNKRIITKRGIISRKTEEMKIGSIETVELSQGVFGRIFGFGNVRITGRGSSDVVMRSLDDPLDVKRRIESVSHPVV